MSENVIPGEAEERARAQGWKPEEEWQGDKSKWVPADQFLEINEKVHKVKSRNLERELREVKELLQIQHQSMQKAERAGYQRALDDIAKRQRQAVEQADTEAYDAAERDKERIIREVQEKQQESPKVDPAFEDWLEDNEWYSTDPDMKAYADGIVHTVMQSGFTGKALYREVGKRAKEVFKHKFQNPRREEPSAVEGGGSKPKKGGKTFDDLPAEGKKAFERFAKQIPGFTKEDYLKNYVWE